MSRKGIRWFLPESPDVVGMLQKQAAITVNGMEAFAAWAETAVGQAFIQRMPGRFDGIDLGPEVGETGLALLLPLRATDTLAGVLVALRPKGAQPFSAEVLDMMAAFVDQAALAWQLAGTQRRMRELDVLTDRDRIAQDLHEHVIQRLFAVGLALQGTIPRARVPEVQARLTGCVDDLQEVIQEIRTAIFDLHGAQSGVTRLRQRLDEAVAQFADPKVRTTVQFSRSPLGRRPVASRSRRRRRA